MIPESSQRDPGFDIPPCTSPFSSSSLAGICLLDDKPQMVPTWVTQRAIKGTLIMTGTNSPLIRCHPFLECAGLMKRTTCTLPKPETQQVSFRDSAGPHTWTSFMSLCCIPLSFAFTRVFLFPRLNQCPASSDWPVFLPLPYKAASVTSLLKASVILCSR